MVSAHAGHGRYRFRLPGGDAALTPSGGRHAPVRRGGRSGPSPEPYRSTREGDRHPGASDSRSSQTRFRASRFHSGDDLQHVAVDVLPVLREVNAARLDSVPLQTDFDRNRLSRGWIQQDPLVYGSGRFCGLPVPQVGQQLIEVSRAQLPPKRPSKASA